MTNPEALYQTLADAPNDWQARSVLADWYEEAGRQDVADCLRWMIAQRKRPYRPLLGRQFYWFNAEQSDQESDLESDVPEPLYRLLRGEEGVPNGYREYAELRAADEDFYQAWAAARVQG